VFFFGPQTLALTVPQGSVFASMDEDEMLKVMKKVANHAELACAVPYLLTAVGACAPPHVEISIDPSERRQPRGATHLGT
jgi:hypothetical protein